MAKQCYLPNKEILRNPLFLSWPAPHPRTTCLYALGRCSLVLLVEAEVAELEHLLVRLPLEEEAQLLADRLHRLRKRGEENIGISEQFS